MIHIVLGLILTLALYFIIISISLRLLDRLKWFRKFKGGIPWYIDIWKPLSTMAIVSLVRAVFGK